MIRCGKTPPRSETSARGRGVPFAGARAGVVLLSLGLALGACASARAGSAHDMKPRRQAALSASTDWILVTERDPQALVAQVRVIVRSGGLSDPERLPGLAHFTARALLRGTRTRPFKELTESIERLGGTLQVRVDQTQTLFEGAVLARNLEAYLDLLRDVLTQPAFDPLEMSTLQKLIQGELRSQLQDVQAVAARAALQAAYDGRPGMHSPQGTVDSVGRITPSEAAAFFRARYVRPNLLVALVSSLADDSARALLADRLHSLPDGALDAPALPTFAPVARRAILVPRANLSTVPLFVVTPGAADGDAELPALEVGNFVFGADFTSRLSRILRGENGWTYGAYSSFGQLLAPRAQAGLFSLYTYPSTEHAALAIPRAVALLEEYASGDVAEAEFAAAISALSNRYAFALDSAEKRLGLRIREILHGRSVESLSSYRARLQSLERGALNALIRGRHAAAGALIVAVGDPAELEPILSGLPGVRSVERVEIRP